MIQSRLKNVGMNLTCWVLMYLNSHSSTVYRVEGNYCFLLNVSVRNYIFKKEDASNLFIG